MLEATNLALGRTEKALAGVDPPERAAAGKAFNLPMHITRAGAHMQQYKFDRAL
jgi:hypothetical protein